MLFRGMDGRKVELVCAKCGYGIVVATVPETCPMCRASAWDLPAWRPFTLLAEYHVIFDKAERLSESARLQPPPAFDPLELAPSAPRSTRRRAAHPSAAIS